MKSFSVSGLIQSSVLYLYSTKDEIQIDPDYQRMGEIWTLDKRQLLIDSILNGFDVPKIYFHELGKAVDGKRYKYAIIDGRQRLESIWSFIDGNFPLADDFEYLNDSSVSAAGLTYRELAESYPRIKATFDATTLSVIVVRTDDRDLIEEMFSRLNEAVPLNAAEKRNAFGGPVPKAIREIAGTEFFKVRLAISNRRYQHRDLAAKFLYLCHERRIADTKKVYLDAFVKNNRNMSLSRIRSLKGEVLDILERMNRVFLPQDSLLRSAGMAVLYFIICKDALAKNWIRRISRSAFVDFEKARRSNRLLAERDITKAKYNLLEFDRLTQTPNDAYAIANRFETLKEFLTKRRGSKPA